MTALRSQQATNWREGRRLRAWELSQKGWHQHRIAEALGVTKGRSASGSAGPGPKAPKPGATANLPAAGPG